MNQKYPNLQVTNIEELAIAYSPAVLASILREAGYNADSVLDLIKETADKNGGYNPRLDKVALFFLKPDAPEGEEKSA